MARADADVRLRMLVGTMSADWQRIGQENKREEGGRERERERESGREREKEMNGVFILHCKALPGNEMNIIMKHAPSAGSIAHLVDQQSNASALPLCYIRVSPYKRE